MIYKPEEDKNDQNGTMDDDVKALARFLHKHSIWSVPPVSEDPEVRLSPWQIYAVKDNFHFVGHRWGWGEGRVSTPIVSFDLKTLRGVTESGRVYQLVGPPGFDREADYVLGRWLFAQGLKYDEAVVVPADEFPVPESD